MADRDTSQTEFAAITIQTLRLPNPQIQSEDECSRWYTAGLLLHPLKLILEILCELTKLDQMQGYITPDELVRIVIPLSGAKAALQDYVNFILWYRAGEITLIGWPNCTDGANDFRIAREYLLFLNNYGYLERPAARKREEKEYHVKGRVPFESTGSDIFQLIAYVMAKHADPSIPDTPEEWLDNFNTFSIYQVLPKLIQLWGLNVQTDVQSKKTTSYRPGNDHAAVPAPLRTVRSVPARS